MSLITNIYPQNHAFTRNPILVSVSAPTLATYKVYANNILVFTGNGTGNFTVNISEILETVFGDTNTPVGNGMLLMMEQYNNYTYATFEVTTDGEDTETVSITAWKGGINNADYRYLRNQGTSIFSVKLMNYSGNFFFTTRSYGWTICMKETELEPLALVMPTIPGEVHMDSFIKIRETVTGRLIQVNGYAGVLMALNMEAVRKEFFVRYGVLANLFDIIDPYHSSRVACRIAIEEAENAPERCAVRFLNSFGVYERIDLIGKMMISTIQNDYEDGTFKKYDEVTDSFVKSRTRTAIGQVYKVKTGEKRTEELNFIMDMLASDSVYLVLPDSEIKVIPSIENMARAYRQTEPENMEITFKPVEEESNFTAVATNYGSTRPRIFTSKFSEQFN